MYVRTYILCTYYMYLNISFLLLGDDDDSEPMKDGEQMGDDNGE